MSNVRPPGGLLNPRIPDEIGIIPAGGTTGQLLAKASAADRAVTWVDPPSGGGSGSMTIWDPEKPPGSPSSYDIEYCGTSALSAWPAPWTAMASGGFNNEIFPATEPTQYSAQITGGAWKGYSCLLPAGDFNLGIRCAAFGANANYGLVGIGIGNNANATGSTTQYSIVAGYHSSNGGFGIYGDYQGAIGDAWGAEHAVMRGVTLWMRRVGSVYTAGWSPNGLRGVEATSRTPAWSGTHMMIVGYGSQTIAQIIKWVRFVGGTGTRQTWGGTRAV